MGIDVLQNSHLLSLDFLTAQAVSDKTCSLPVEEAGIMWDSICFLCLLLQRRIFLSFYFLHVTTELQASAKQASRYDSVTSLTDITQTCMRCLS